MKLLRHMGTRYTPAQVLRMIKRARRFAVLREEQELDSWLSAIRKM